MTKPIKPYFDRSASLNDFRRPPEGSPLHQCPWEWLDFFELDEGMCLFLEIEFDRRDLENHTNFIHYYSVGDWNVYTRKRALAALEAYRKGTPVGLKRLQYSTVGLDLLIEEWTIFGQVILLSEDTKIDPTKQWTEAGQALQRMIKYMPLRGPDQPEPDTPEKRSDQSLDYIRKTILYLESIRPEVRLREQYQKADARAGIMVEDDIEAVKLRKRIKNREEKLEKLAKRAFKRQKDAEPNPQSRKKSPS